jgi:hypothetical protein
MQGCREGGIFLHGDDVYGANVIEIMILCLALSSRSP